uniref:hypothetical protein n=1 Tax=Bangia atropurpurea TaxID=31347 RepID=UPI0007C5F247|nr:hypothetical protein MW410_pgp122 [Bangia atropurpurea]UNJ18258.1 hypothetical protein [Bangia atropurpurea]
MNKFSVLVQILCCKSIKTINNENQIIRLKVRFNKRKGLSTVNLLLWNKQSLEIFKLFKQFDYIIVEGKLHRNEKIEKKSNVSKQKDITISASRIFKYKSLL